MTITSSSARSTTAAYKIIDIQPVLLAAGAAGGSAGAAKSNAMCGGSALSGIVTGMVVDKTTAVFEKRATASRMPPALADAALSDNAAAVCGVGGGGVGSGTAEEPAHDADLNAIALLPVEDRLRDILAACFSAASLQLGLKHPVL